MMCDDLIQELDIVLNSERESVCSSKLKTYFNDSDDNDDLFAPLIKEYIPSNNSIDNKFSDNKSAKHVSDGKIKSVRFSDSFDGDIDNTFKELHNQNVNYSIGSAWLTSESTKVTLTKIMSKEISTSQVNKSLLARPQLHTDPNTRLSDPIFSLLCENYNTSTASEMRQVPTIDNCPDTEEELSRLLKRCWIRPTIDLTSRILHRMGFTYAKSQSIDSTSSSFTVESGRIWNLRFSLLVRMKLFVILESELSGFQNLDCPNLYHEFNHDWSSVAANKGSLIPFSLRIIHAELPCFFNRFSEALNRLYYLLAIIRRILVNLKGGYSEDGTKYLTEEPCKRNITDLWCRREVRVLLSIVRVLITSKDYTSAIEIVREIVLRSVAVPNRPLVDALNMLLARVYLHLGDLDKAAICFEEAVKAIRDDESLTPPEKESIVAAKVNLQNAYVNISRGSFEEAKLCFQEHLERQPNDVTVLNNYAVCCLYLKKVQEAISVFEKLIDKGVRHDALIFNLCILYELQTTQVKNKKLKIVKLLSSTVGDDFNISSFKLSNSE